MIPIIFASAATGIVVGLIIGVVADVLLEGEFIALTALGVILFTLGVVVAIAGALIAMWQWALPT